MIARWHFLTGEYPPEPGGIASYAAAMAEALADRGADVHVWSASGGGLPGSARVTVHQLPDRFGPRTLDALHESIRSLPGRVVLHYAPNALGARGANLRFCRWFAAQGRNAWDARVLFHEPFLYFGRQSLARNALAVLHRVMAAALLSANHEVYMSTPAWRPLLERYALGDNQWKWIPITAGAPQRASSEAAAVARANLAHGARWLVGTFGTYAPEIRPIVRSGLVATLASCPDAHVVCIGRNSLEFRASVGEVPRLSATGELPDDQVSAAIAACDLMLQPFPEGVTCRRTSLLRCLAAGMPVVTTAGRYTEEIWHTSGAVSMVPADQPEALGPRAALLLADAGARGGLGEAARFTYESSFSPTALLDALDTWTPANCASCS